MLRDMAAFAAADIEAARAASLFLWQCRTHALSVRTLQRRESTQSRHSPSVP